MWRMEGGIIHGQGKMIFDTREVYDGSWDDVIMHGPGEYLFESGERLIGEWNCGKKDGFFLRVLANGRKIQEFYDKDTRVDNYD